MSARVSPPLALRGHTLRTLRRALGVVLAVCAALLAAAAPASAALPLTFDGLSAGTTVTNQFAADKVTFLDPPGVSSAPLVKNVGSKARSGTNVAVTGCPGCEFDDREILIAFSTFADTVDIYAGIDSNQSTTQNIQVLPLNASQLPLQTRDVQLDSDDFNQFIHVDPSGNDNIAFLRITINNGFNLGIDDLSATFPALATPDVGLTAGGSGVLIRQGGTATLPLQVLRFNGSSGGVDLQTPFLPGGVTSAFSPDPVTGSASAPSTMTLSASATATLGTSTRTIRGVPAGAGVAPGNRETTFSLTVEPAFELTTERAADATPCAPTTQQLFVTRARSGFGGRITLSVDPLDGYAAELGETTLDGSGSHVVPITFRSTRSDPPATAEAIVRATSPGLSEQEQRVRLTRRAGSITSFSPTTGQTPWNARPGSFVRITGSGFCEGATVRFGNELAEVPATVDASGTSLTAVVPRLATTGPLTVNMPGNAITSADTFTVNSPRNTQGFAFENYDHPGVDLDAVTDLYGAAQTQLSFDPCNPLPGIIPPICPIPTGIPNPLTGVYIAISNAALSSAGSCFGIGVTTQHIATGLAPIDRFTPAGATNAWQLNAATGPDPALARRIQTWHTSQLSSSYLGYWIDTAAANVSNGGRGSRSTIAAELAAGRHPIIAIRFGGSGHALVAHDLRGTADGGYDVDVWDTNLPFLATENTNATEHRDRTDRSVIHVDRNGHWTYQGGFDPTWGGGSDQMVAAPLSVMGSRPVMPTDPHGVVTLLVPLASSAATVEQVTDGDGKPLLDDKGELITDPAKRAKGTITPTLTGTDSHPMYAVKDRTASVELSGTDAGLTGANILTPGMAAEISGLRTRKGSGDQLKVFGKGGSVEFDAGLGGNVQASLARELPSGDQLGANLRVGGAGQGDHALILNGGASGLVYDNGGSTAAAVSGTLSWAGKKGVPGQTTLPAFRVPAGGSAQVTPTSWGKLGSSPLRLRVEDRSGKVVRRITVRPRGLRAVSRVTLAVAKAKAGHEASLRVRFGAVPKGATVQIGVFARQGKKLVATKTLAVDRSKARGTKSYRLPITLPKGTSTVYGTATVLAGRATQTARATKRVTVE